MDKDVRQHLKRLQREGHVVSIEPTKKSHWRLVLRNGRVYTVAATPSDWRALRNMVAEIQRILRLT